MSPKPTGNGSDPQGEQPRDRTRQNLLVLGVLFALLLSGLWLYSTLRAYLKIEACVEAGYRDCVPIDRDAPR